MFEGYTPGDSSSNERFFVSTEPEIEKPTTLSEGILMGLQEMNEVEEGARIKEYINGLPSDRIETVDYALNLINETFSSLPLSAEEDGVLEVLKEMEGYSSGTEIPDSTRKKLKQLLQ